MLNQGEIVCMRDPLWLNEFKNEKGTKESKVQYSCTI